MNSSAEGINIYLITSEYFTYIYVEKNEFCGTNLYNDSQSKFNTLSDRVLTTKNLFSKDQT